MKTGTPLIKSVGITSPPASLPRTPSWKASTAASAMNVSMRRCSHRSTRPGPKSPSGRRTTTDNDRTARSATSRRSSSPPKSHWKRRPDEATNKTQDSPINRREYRSQVKIHRYFHRYRGQQSKCAISTMHRSIAAKPSSGLGHLE
jgi:hypothetical protein